MKKYIDVFQSGSTFHVYNRVVGNEKLFFKEKNYTYFLEKLNDKASAYIDIMAYCLLRNHYHLLIKVKDTAKPKEVSEAFRKFGISYSQAINKQEGRKGSLFMKPVKRKRIDSKEYFITVLVYIHTNPYLHGIENNYQTYKWSSFRFYRDAIAPSDGISDKPSDSIPVTLFKTKEIIQNYFDDKENFIFVHEQKRGFGGISDLIIED
ncbi:MAG: hypothetical protein B7C24_15040 [Bacteroidetes bacterium 4572_77]|nr:MAG: hypothetical protein B7C24_15040 [Bacteroidetes bacterium 4572_77]